VIQAFGPSYGTFSPIKEPENALLEVTWKSDPFNGGDESTPMS
jgi:hypothetical protein